MGACPPSQLALLTRWEGILVNAPREMEYSKDRLNHEIRELTRNNAMLKEALYRKDKEHIDLQMRLNESNEAVNTLSVILGVVLLLLIGVTIAAIRHWGGIP